MSAPAVQYYSTSFGVVRVDAVGRIALVKGAALVSMAVIDRAASAADPAPSEAQQQAGNYAKGHVRLHGLDITIENPKGSTRSGVDRNGKRWSTTMRHHYGYLKRTEGADGDHVDVFIGPHPTSQLVYIIDQVNPESRRFDEHKVVLGARSREEAEQVYLANYQPGWRGIGAVSEMDLQPFKDWLANGDTTEPLRNAEARRKWYRDLRAVLGQGTTKSRALLMPRPGFVHRFAEALRKAGRPVQHRNGQIVATSERLTYLLQARERINRELLALAGADPTDPIIAARRADLRRQLTELDLRIDELRTTD